MILENGIVVRVRGDMAWVETRRQSACGACDVANGCGTSLLSRLLGQKRTRVEALNSVGAATGDEVVVGIEEQALVKGSLMVYLLPLLALFAGALLFEWLFVSLGETFAPGRGFNAEAATIVGGGVGLILGFVWLKSFGRRIRDDGRYRPVIVERKHGDQIDGLRIE